MATTTEGPPLETLLRRLAETPEDFLAAPRIGASGRIDVAAVVGDLAESFGGFLGAEELRAFEGASNASDRNRLAVVLLLCWLLTDEWFRGQDVPTDRLLQLLEASGRELAASAPSKRFVEDADRREEMARHALARLGFRPAGESAAQAEDRLTSLSSAERTRVLKAAREAEARARKIREALKRKAAEESADKWTRE